jgi:xylitol oxidase
MTGRRANWAGNVVYQAERLHQPTSVEQLQELVARSGRIRALGTGHSFNGLADSSGDQVSLAGLPALVEIDTAASTVSVGAGMRYGEVGRRLQEEGYALANLASLPHISVVGACATATHGSGTANRNLAAAVSAVELVTAGGETETLSRQADGEEFRGAVVALGMLGIVTKVWLDIVPTFDIRQYVYENLARAQLVEHLEEILSAAYSVSLFTDWQDSQIDQVWLKRRVDEDDDWVPPPQWMGARLADGPRNPVPGVSPVNCTPQMGLPGPWNERLPHFRLEFTPSFGDELQSEYLIDRRHLLAALEALDQIADQLAPALHTSEIRTIAADDLWLSPSYHRDSAALHFTWINNTAAITLLLGRIEEQLAPFQARPHWGKLFTTSSQALSGLYDRIGDFGDLVSRYDPAGKFGNAFLDRYIPTG